MRQKVSTLLDENLYRRIKLHAVRKGKKISQVLEEALERYLENEVHSADTVGVARSSFGAIRADKDRVREILEDEDGLFDT